jgi:hypothetical protein
MSEANILTAAPPPALFTLDLGENGGVLAPTSASDLHGWIDAEIQAWSWLDSVSSGNHKAAVDNAIGPLRNAHGHAQQALQYESSPDALRQQAAQVQAYIQDAHVTKRFPHSKSALGHRIEELRKRDPLEAVAYLYTKLPHATNYQFDARDISSWKGFLTGLNEELGMEGIPQRGYEAALRSMGGTQAELAKTLAEKTEAANALHRNYEQVVANIAEARANR